MRKILYSREHFQKRRNQLKELMAEGEAFVLFSTPQFSRNSDVDHYYRASSDLFYFTGFEEASSVFVFTPGQKKETTLFVHPKDPKFETWEGFLFGVEGAKSEFGMDQCFSIKDIDQKLPEVLNSSNKVYYKMFDQDLHDRVMSQALQKVKRKTGRSGKGLLPIVDPSSLVGQLRLIKSDHEITLHKNACQISAEAHNELKNYAKPGVTERELHGLFLFEIMKRGAAREGYPAIMASGNNATTLHYRFNDAVLKKGDLLLIDAGAEYNYLTGDITRTFPVGGVLEGAQKDLYNSVLKVQEDLVEKVQVGTSFADLNSLADKMLAQVLIDLKISKQSVEELIENKDIKKYYPHSLGHYLGMDVHDIGPYKDIKGQNTPFQAGMCLTIEPGLYFPENMQGIPDAFKGLGVRIEDDILVTKEGPVNMTVAAEK